jgi:quercetin dioxygenase-like cupin family protein
MFSVRKISLVSFVLGVVVTLALAVSSSTSAQSATATAAATEEVTLPNYAGYDQLHWQPCAGLEGCDMVIVHGNPQTGASQVFWHVQPNVQIPAHWNTTPEHIIGIAGEMVFIDAKGNKQSVKAGDYLYSPSKQVKAVTCAGKVACVIFDYDELAFDFNLANK